jgi:PAS domain S-box-containing protein
MCRYRPLTEGYRQLVERLPAAVYTCAADGRVLMCNEAAIELWGRTPVIGEEKWCGSFKIFAPDGARVELDTCPMAIAIQQGRAQSGIEIVIERPDGTRRNVLAHPQPLHDERGVVIGAVNMLIDVTDRRASDTARLEAQRAAEEASRAKDEFLAVLGHELRNPLAPIVTALQLMDQRGEPAALMERAVIARHVEHLVRLVDDLLDVSRITRGRIELSRQHVELTSVVTQAIELASPLLEQRAHELTVHTDRDLYVHGDPVRLTQVVSNLLTNAARYTEPHGRIALTARRHGNTVRITVADNGIGIEPSLRAAIFELFVQGARTSDRARGGLGLGLAIVKNLVELHGGKVSVQSDGPGHGSAFTIELPAIEAIASVDDSMTTRRMSALTAGPHVAAPADTRRVLIVDDNDDAAETLAEALRQSGHDVRVAHDGPSALALAAGYLPEVALLDIGLPVMDGYELARRLRAALPSPPFLVAITGYGQASDRQQAMDAGFDAHFVKPVSLPAIRGMLASRTPNLR